MTGTGVDDVRPVRAPRHIHRLPYDSRKICCNSVIGEHHVIRRVAAHRLRLLLEGFIHAPLGEHLYQRLLCANRRLTCQTHVTYSTDGAWTDTR